MPIDRDAAAVAAQCRHYAMCKIDFLGTGLCPAARDNYYVSYYPQGRMDIYAALARGTLPLTQALKDIAAACDLCGICDKQCYFVTQLRPLAVARALKKRVAELLLSGEPAAVPADDVLEALQRIVGERWATNDAAHREAYADDPSPVSRRTPPRYVALPAGTDEVQKIIRLCREQGLAYAVRGNGSSVMGFVLTPGLVIDTARMKKIEFDERNWCVRVGAGVSAFELQQAARNKGYRVNVAEPSALYIANLVCSGVFSLFSAGYGTAADNILDAVFVSDRGEVFRLGDPEAPNLSSFQRADRPAPGVCTEALVRLHPVTDDESAAAVPFPDLSSAVAFARDLARRGIGIGLGVLGGEYLGSFMAPTKELARAVKDSFVRRLGVDYIVMVLGDRHALKAARELAPAVFSPAWMRAVWLGLPALADGRVASLLEGLEGKERPSLALAREEMIPVMETLLDSSPEHLASVVDEDLRAFFTELYARPEMTDMLWLNTFRIVSSRMGRDGHVVAFIVYVPLDDIPQAVSLHEAFSAIARRHGVRGDFGFITPLDRGRMAVFEWDMYLDHTDDEQVGRMQRAMGEAGAMIEGFSGRDPRVLWIRWVFNQGMCRKESFLYHEARGDRP